MNVYIHLNTHNRGDSLTVQKGNVCASSWMDRKVVTVMSTTTQPELGTVQRRQRDGTRITVTCPLSIMDYNQFMTGVTRFEGTTVNSTTTNPSSTAVVANQLSCQLQPERFDGGEWCTATVALLEDVGIRNGDIKQKKYL